MIADSMRWTEMRCLPLRRNILHPLLQLCRYLFYGELEPLPVRDAFGGNGVLGAAGVDASDPEGLAPCAELAAEIGRRQPERLGQRLEAQPFRVKGCSVGHRDRHTERGVEPPAQIYAGDFLRLDHQTVAGGYVLARPQHLLLEPLAEHRCKVSRGFGIWHGAVGTWDRHQC